MAWLRAFGRWLLPWRWLGVLIVVGWAGVMWQLVQHKSIKSAKELEELFPWAVKQSLHTGTQWMGVYLKGKKIGYTRTTIQKRLSGYRIVQLAYMQMKVFGRRQRLRVGSEVRVNQKYRLRSFLFRFGAGSRWTRFQARGVVKGMALHISLSFAGRKQLLRLPYKPSLLPSVLRPYIAAQKPPVGQRIATWLFDPKSLAYKRSVVIVEAYETLRIGGQSYKAMRLRQDVQGLKVLAWIDDKGRSLKETSAMGMVLVREEASEAMKGIEKQLDVVKATRIKVIGRLHQPRTRRHLRVVLENISLSAFPGLVGLRQRKIKGALEIRKAHKDRLPRLPFSPLSHSGPVRSRPTPQRAYPYVRATPLPSKQRYATELSSHQPLSSVPWSRIRPPTRRVLVPRLRPKPTARQARRASWGKKTLQSMALASTALVQSQAPVIKQKARELTAHATDRVQALWALYEWTHQTLKKQSVIGIPSALETLKSGVGDCNEHATLFAALARSLKIPCTVSVGVAYMKSHFYFHAWNECYVGKKQWVSIDATWGQFPADVTHIAFARGKMDKQSVLLQLLGKLRIRILP